MMDRQTRSPAVTGARTINDDWKDAAACKGQVLEFVGTQGHESWAREVCARCTVRLQCLEYAFEQPTSTQFGVYGGVTGPQRMSVQSLPWRIEILTDWFDRWMAARKDHARAPREHDLDLLQVGA